MSTRCQANGGCDKEQAWHCRYLTTNGIYGRSLCVEHADIWMRANHDHGPWANPAIPLQVSKVVFEEGKAIVHCTLMLKKPIDYIVTNLTIKADPAVMGVEDVPVKFEGVLDAMKDKP